MVDARSRSAHDGAFTLIEVMIVVALIGLLVGASVIGIGSVFRTKLRSAASRTAGAMRIAFDKARLTGEHIRLAVDLEKGKLWLEASPHGFTLREGREQHVTTDEAELADQEAARTKPSRSLLPMGLGGSADESGGDEGGMPLGIDPSFVQGFEQDLEPIRRPKAYFQPVKGPGSAKLQLAGRVRFAAVMTAHLEAPADDGVAYIYFFPQGHAEPAIVQLKDDDESYYSIVLHPLTGQAKVHACRYRIPKTFGQPEASARHRDSPCEDR